MNFEKLFEEFRSEDFDPIPELHGSGIVVGTRIRSPQCLTYHVATGMLAVHGAIATGLLLQPGESMTFEITITQVSVDRGIGRAATLLHHPEDVGDRYVILNGLLRVLNNLSRAID